MRMEPKKILPPDVLEWFRQQGSIGGKLGGKKGGEKGGKIGGKRRLVTLTPERRSEIAKNAAVARWAKKTKAAGG
jgi:hypothetical protein